MEIQKGIILFSLQDDRIPPGAADRIRVAGEGRELAITLDDKRVEGILDKIEIGFGDVPFHLLARMPRLKWVQLWSAGADRIQQYPELKKLPFLLTSTSGIHGQQLAEHTFGMILAWNRAFPRAFAAQQRREWLRIDDSRISVLSGKTMLILGYGSIGESIARVAHAFNMKVVGLRRHPEKASVTEGVTILGAEKMGEELPHADIVVNILPATVDTYHLIGAAEFSLMKQEALYVNIGRGATTDEAALAEALRAKWIAGALLDVTEEEPLPSTSPLWDLENVMLLGHYAGMHPDYGKLALEIALDNLGRYVRGEPLKNVVDKNLGY